jgi:hypothetical protein
VQADPSLDQARAEIVLGNADRIDAGTGRGRLNLKQTARAMGDSTAPEVAVAAPTDGAVVFGTVNVQASATDNVKVAGVTFFLDDTPLGREDTAAPFEAAWTTTESPDGSHTIKAVARDTAGNQAVSALTLTVANDLEAPTVTLTSPSSGSALSGVVKVSATASDDRAVHGVQFVLDGVPLGGEDNAEPFEVSWNTRDAANGGHVLTAVARDAAGKESTATVAVTVANDAAAPTVSIATSGNTSGTIMIKATAVDDVGVVAVQFFVDGFPLGAEAVAAPYEAAWDTLSARNGVHMLSVVARDASGKRTKSSIVVTIANDLTAPVVAIASPVSGGVVAGLVAILAQATDDTSVAGVQFQLDGVAVGVEDTVAPYEFLWDAAAVPNGTHTFSAVARDAAGRQSTSPGVVITVANEAAEAAVP